MPSNLSDRHVSPLRARMIEDMTVRGFTEKTRSLIAAVFAADQRVLRARRSATKSP